MGCRKPDDPWELFCPGTKSENFSHNTEFEWRYQKNQNSLLPKVGSKKPVSSYNCTKEASLVALIPFYRKTRLLFLLAATNCWNKQTRSSFRLWGFWRPQHGGQIGRYVSPNDDRFDGFCVWKWAGAQPDQFFGPRGIRARRILGIRFYWADSSRY